MFKGQYVILSDNFFLNQLIKKWIAGAIETTLEFLIHLNQGESYGRRRQSWYKLKDIEGENSKRDLPFNTNMPTGSPCHRILKNGKSLSICLMKKITRKKVTNLSKNLYISTLNKTKPNAEKTNSKIFNFLCERRNLGMDFRYVVIDAF